MLRYCIAEERTQRICVASCQLILMLCTIQGGP